MRSPEKVESVGALRTKVSKLLNSSTALFDEHDVNLVGHSEV
jgi:hypothetical protein